MYKASIMQHFDAAHCLRGYPGRCENLHGHRWQVAVEVAAEELDPLGLSYDFTRLKAILKYVLNRYDHANLNEVPPFDAINPTAENIARTIFEQCEKELKGESVNLQSVTVWESPDAWVTYRSS